MSWTAASYVKKLKVDKNGKKLSKGHKLVLFVLADYHNEERGDAWTSLRRLAIESLYSRAGLILAIRSLEKGGLIQVVRDQNAAKTRITNHYIFPDLPTITNTETRPALVKPVDHPGIVAIPGLVYPLDHPGIATIPGVVYPLDHIFPKNLSNLSFQIQEKSVANEMPVDNCVDVGGSSERFEEFTETYPHRAGKKLERAATKALFLMLSPEEQALAIKAAGHYSVGLKSQGLLAKDQKRFLLDASGHAPWRDWIDPPTPTPQRAPPPPPKTDPIARGHWRQVYGNPKDHGFE